MTWWTYVQGAASGASQKRIAEMAGVDQSTVSRWKRGGSPKAQNAILFARSAGRPVLEALIAAGEITPTEARQRPSGAPSLDSLTNRQLLDEIEGRMKGGGSDSGQDEAKKSPDSGGGSGASVTQLRPSEEPRPADTFDPYDQRRVASRPSQEEREARRQAEAESAHIDDENQDPEG